MTVIVPVRDLKNTASFADLVAREREVKVTRNGYDAFSCVSAEQRKLELEEMARAKLLSRIMLAESELEAGDYDDYDEFAAGLKERYGL